MCIWIYVSYIIRSIYSIAKKNINYTIEEAKEIALKSVNSIVAILF